MLIPLARLIDGAHELQEQETRYHLGCSEAGHSCQRYVWLKFRWAIKEAKCFNPSKNHRSWGQKLRLFRRGHREEDVVISDLRSVGCVVSRQQEHIEPDGHLGGSIDGVVSGVPDVDGDGLLEIKTHAVKSFNQLEKHGVLHAKPQHFMQMQLYMRSLGLDWALYAAVCKDDDRYHFEVVKFEKDVEFFARNRAIHTSLKTRPPEQVGGADWWECKMCVARKMCHESAPAIEVNCRTCALSTPMPDGTWLCEKANAAIPNEEQEKAHGCHVLHMDLVPWQMESIGEPHHVAWTNGDQSVINGDPSELDGAKTSEEILEQWHKRD